MSQNEVIYDDISDDEVIYDGISDNEVNYDDLFGGKVDYDDISDDDVIYDDISDDEVNYDDISDNEVIYDDIYGDEVTDPLPSPEEFSYADDWYMSYDEASGDELSNGEIDAGASNNESHPGKSLSSVAQSIRYVHTSLNFVGLSLYTGEIIHYSNVIMSSMMSQITCVSAVCSIFCSDADQRKHQSSASLVFVRGIHRWPVDSLHKGPVNTRDTGDLRRHGAWYNVTVVVWGNWTHGVQTEATSPVASCPERRGFVQHLVWASNERNVKVPCQWTFLSRILPVAGGLPSQSVNNTDSVLWYIIIIAGEDYPEAPIDGKESPPENSTASSWVLG